MVREDRYVTSAFVRVLMVELVERRRPWITLETANDQTVAIVRRIPGSGSVLVPPVSRLAQRLAEAYAEAFAWDGSRLVLTEQAVSDRPAVLEALRRFRAAANAEAPPTKGAEATEARPDPAAKEIEALDHFFDGFEKEIMRARLGQDTDPDHG